MYQRAESSVNVTVTENGSVTCQKRFQFLSVHIFEMLWLGDCPVFLAKYTVIEAVSLRLPVR